MLINGFLFLIVNKIKLILIGVVNKDKFKLIGLWKINFKYCWIKINSCLLKEGGCFLGGKLVEGFKLLIFKWLEI